MPELKVQFGHGLGDCVQFAHVLRVYEKHGYSVTVEAESNKMSLWRACGIAAVPAGAGFPRHAWGYPREFEDLSAPDWRGNKTAFGAVSPPMPPLMDQESLWREICATRIDATPTITPEARAECEQFLANLPRPIICLHTRGTNWQSRKSLPIEVAFQLVLAMLDRTGGSVVSLDFDRREPIVGDARCKGIKPSWGHISVDRLLALYEAADLMIGVDSGPFHVANLSQIKCLGVFLGLHPVRVCVPNPNAVYLVSSRHHEHWLARSSQWRFAEYHRQTPTALDIASIAEQLLVGIEPTLVTDDHSAHGSYLYRRVGFDERRLELRADGTIGEGAADCERVWFVTDGRLVIQGDHGIIAVLTKQDDGIWRGNWTRFERMPIELIRQPSEETSCSASTRE